ncbi:alpha/beta hydrolase [Myceligenerans salitolerans]|uniref:Alpha/beta hydrolase n=1 Tax=Myceligenerans salitolerans TaxID=1230528 RepID=A0ABS3IDV9_9MICO|nr:alpha/beta hydrolase [Myceligenerans salitolerans]MBO0611232.1 alpha/beta hydrolase [Myceligenerans salitolerans]
MLPESSPRPLPGPAAMDPLTAAVLARMRRAYPDLGGDIRRPAEARELVEAARYPPGPRMREVTERSIADGTAARLYLPQHLAPGDPTIVYFHGGGFVVGSLDTHDTTCRVLAADAGLPVLSVAYRLAPEHPFPAAVEDAASALSWAAGHGDEWGARGVIAAGDSAGGALAVLGWARARGRRAERRSRPGDGPEVPDPVVGALLIYPVADLGTSWVDGPPSLLTAAHMRWFRDLYLAGADPRDPLASPLYADLAGLPPAIVVRVSHDPLLAEGQLLVTTLREQGVDVELVDGPGVSHGMFGLGSLLPAVRELELATGNAVRSLVRRTCQRTREEAGEPGACDRRRSRRTVDSHGRDDEDR